MIFVPASPMVHEFEVQSNVRHISNPKCKHVRIVLVPVAVTPPEFQTRHVGFQAIQRDRRRDKRSGKRSRPGAARLLVAGIQRFDISFPGDKASDPFHNVERGKGAIPMELHRIRSSHFKRVPSPPFPWLFCVVLKSSFDGSA